MNRLGLLGFSVLVMGGALASPTVARAAVPAWSRSGLPPGLLLGESLRVATVPQFLARANFSPTSSHPGAQQQQDDGGFVPYEESTSAVTPQPAPPPPTRTSPAEPSPLPAPGAVAPAPPPPLEAPHPGPMRLQEPMTHPPWELGTMGLQLLSELVVGLGAGLVGIVGGIVAASGSGSSEGALVGGLVGFILVTAVTAFVLEPIAVWLVGGWRGGNGSLGWTFLGMLGGILVNMGISVLLAGVSGGALPSLLALVEVAVSVAAPIMGYHFSYARKVESQQYVRLPERTRRLSALRAVSERRPFDGLGGGLQPVGVPLASLRF